MRLVAHVDFAFEQHRAVEGRGAVEITYDAQQHRWILRLRIGIKGSHHAAVTQLFSVNAHVADGDDLSRSFAFFQVWNVGKKNVRT